MNEQIEPLRILGWFSFDKEMSDEEFNRKLEEVTGG